VAACGRPSRTLDFAHGSFVSEAAPVNSSKYRNRPDGDCMPKSGQLRMQDIREIYRLIGDCRDLGADPVLWHGRMMDGLVRLIGAATVAGGEGLWLRPTEWPVPVSCFSVCLDARGQEILAEFVREHGVDHDPMLQVVR